MDDHSDEEVEEEVMNMPTKQKFISVAARSGFQVEDLIQAEKEIAATEEVSLSSPSIAAFKCPLARKFVDAIVTDKSLKHHGRPWKGSLTKPSISPSKTLGDAVIKNSYMRL
jgi:hypothetical protein